MKYIKEFEKKTDYYIYYRRFNDYINDIMTNINTLEDNQIEYDIYKMTQDNHDTIIIYGYPNSSKTDILLSNNFKYSPSLSSLYGEMKIDELKNKMKIGNSSPGYDSWHVISKLDLILGFSTNKFNL